MDHVVGQTTSNRISPSLLVEVIVVLERLHEEAQRVPLDSILVDIRPDYPGGDYPLHGSILLRSMNAIIGFVARSIEEEPEMMVLPDPRTRTPPPAATDGRASRPTPA